MLYREDKYGAKISQLGYGCMRFSRKGGALDYEKAEAEIMAAVNQGVNYLDTAYIYPGSEDLVGRVIENNGIRDKVLIATKLPHYLIRTKEGIEKTFKEELSRLRTDHIDYYLMHMLTDVKVWQNLKALGIEDWIKEKKADGSIRNLGFSFHGNTEMFLEILNDYDWDFCQIQYNYLDETSQAGRKGLEAAAEKGIPVIIMEPLRGGKLVNQLPKAAKDVIANNEKQYSAAEWALRWLWDQPAVTCILSGMNSMDQVTENVRIASEAEANHFTDSDREAIEAIRSAIRESEKVGCTGCRYCMPCPAGVDIPGIFYYYNLTGIEKTSSVRLEYAQNMGMKADPGFASKCIGCGKCEKHCPQHINIREMLKKADKALRPLPYKVGIDIARKVIVRKTK